MARLSVLLLVAMVIGLHGTWSEELNTRIFASLMNKRGLASPVGTNEGSQVKRTVLVDLLGVAQQKKKSVTSTDDVLADLHIVDEQKKKSVTLTDALLNVDKAGLNANNRRRAPDTVGQMLLRSLASGIDGQRSQDAKRSSELGAGKAHQLKDRDYFEAIGIAQPQQHYGSSSRNSGYRYGNYGSDDYY